MNKLDATKISLILILEESNSNSEYICELINVIIFLLDGGNSNVQKTIFNYFLSDSLSENFFCKIYDLCLQKIQLNLFYMKFYLII